MLHTLQISLGNLSLATNRTVNVIRAKRNPPTISIEGIHSSNTSNYTVDLNLSSAVHMSEENIIIVCHVVDRTRDLIPGLSLYPKLTTILNRFRRQNNGLSADISKMVREVVLDPAERDYYCFLVRR